MQFGLGGDINATEECAAASLIVCGTKFAAEIIARLAQLQNCVWNVCSERHWSRVRSIGQRLPADSLDDVHATPELVGGQQRNGLHCQACRVFALLRRLLVRGRALSAISRCLATTAALWCGQVNARAAHPCFGMLLHVRVG